MRREIEGFVNANVEKWLQKMNLPTREEVDCLHEMLAKARIEQQDLQKRLAALEARDGFGDKSSK